MCKENSFLQRAGAWLSGYFSTPTLAKGTPTFAVSGANFFNVQLSMMDLVNYLTVIYTLILIVCAIPKLMQSVNFIRHWQQHRDEDGTEGGKK